MSKYESKAKELLDRVERLLGSFEIERSSSGISDDSYAPDKITNQFPDILLDVQTLLFSDSPLHPLYIRAMELNERKNITKSRCERFRYSDFATLKDILQRYLEYRSFLEAGD